MLITRAICEHEAAGLLVRVQPRRGYPIKRGALIAGQAIQELQSSNSAVGALGCRGKVVAMLEGWVSGDNVVARMSGKRSGSNLARLDPPPPEVWEFQMTQSTIQVRALGRFAAPDLFIVTNVHTRTYLGAHGSANWQSALTMCVSEWDRLFPSVSPLIGNRINDYVSEKCVELSSRRK